MGLRTGGGTWFVAAVLASGLAAGQEAHGQCYGNERQKIVASDGAAGDTFGWGLAADGEWLLVGARDREELGTRSGAAYLFRREHNGEWDEGASWVEHTKLLASDGDESDWFGADVALFGNLAVVSASLKEVDGIAGGAVYAYEFDGSMWAEVQKISPAYLETWDAFGFDVAMDGDVLVVGNPTDDDACPTDPICNSGSISIYRWDGSLWNEEAKLTANDAEASALFGWNCAVYGDVIAVGAVYEDGLEVDCGAVYVYRFDGVNWNEEQKIVAPDGAAGDSFGHCVDLDDDVLVIGVQRDDTEIGVDSGCAWVYRFNGVNWVEEQRLLPSAAAAGDNAGFAVDVEPGEILVTSIRHDDAASNGGGWAHYEWDGTSWNERASFTASDAEPEDLLGTRCVLDLGRAFVSAVFEDDLGSAAGAVYETTLNSRNSFSYYGSATFYRGYSRLRPLADPVVGTTLPLEVRHLPRLWSSRGYLFLGTEPRIGGPSLVGGQVEVLSFRPDMRGRTLIDLTIPDDPALCGEHVYAQAVVSGNYCWRPRWRCWSSRAWSRGLDLVVGDSD